MYSISLEVVDVGWPHIFLNECILLKKLLVRNNISTFHASIQNQILWACVNSDRCLYEACQKAADQWETDGQHMTVRTLTMS